VVDRATAAVDSRRIAAGVVGLVWLAVALSKRLHDKTEHSEPDQNLAAEFSLTQKTTSPT
jgi:hypothetical protein